MKKAMVLVGIAATLFAGCSNAETKKEETNVSPKVKTVQTAHVEEQQIEQEVMPFSDETIGEEEQMFEVPILSLDETLLKQVDDIKQDFLQARMTETEGKYTYGDITIDSVKEEGNRISFVLTFKIAVNNKIRNEIIESFHIPVTNDDNRKRAGSFEVSNNKVKKRINWKVVKKQNGNTKQVEFLVETI